MTTETKFISAVAEKIFDSIIDDEDLNRLYDLNIIEQKEGYKSASIALIELELESNPLIKTAPKLYAMLDKIATSPRCAISVAPEVKKLLAEARGE